MKFEELKREYQFCNEELHNFKRYIEEYENLNLLFPLLLSQETSPKAFIIKTSKCQFSFSHALWLFDRTLYNIKFIILFMVSLRASCAVELGLNFCISSFFTSA